MRFSSRDMFVVSLIAAVYCGSSCANAQMDKQAICAAKVEANLRATKAGAPDVAKTIRAYTFEYSRSRASCVIIMQYNTQDKTHGQIVQILAINAFTMQPMEGHRNIFIADRSNTEEIEKAANFLFDRYSR